MGGWRRRLLEVVARDRLAREAADEMAAHVEMLVADYLAAGLSDDEARRRARLEVGSIDAARERVAEERTGVGVEQVWRELWQGRRALARSPGLTMVSALTMGIGIGVSTVLFALVQAVVLRPLPYPEPSSLVRIVDVNVDAGIDRAGVTTGNLRDWRERDTGLTAVAGYYAMGRTLTAGDGAEVVIAAQVTSDFFAVGGVAPLLGRTFSPNEIAAADFNSAAAPTGANPVVVLAHGLWRTRFGADPGIIGRTIQLERRAFRVVGVMPPVFALPDPGVQLWMPWQLAPDGPRDQHYLGGLGRLAPGVSRDTAEARFQRVADDLATVHPSTNRGWSVRLIPLQDDIVGEAAGVLWLLLGAVGLLVLVACANVALLMLMRGLDRAGDTALRLAIGASPARLVREFLMESAWLCGAGGLLGVGMAAACVQALPWLAPDLPRVGETGIGAVGLLFAAVVTMLAALVSGVPQAVRRAHASSAAALGDASPRTAGPARHVLRDAMVVTQMALAVVLLAGSVLLIRSVGALSTVDSGFQTAGVLVAPVFLDSQTYTSGARTRAYYDALFERLAALPGVRAVGGATTVPTSPLGPDFERPVWPAEQADDPSRRLPASVRIVTPGYFDALGLTIAAGRHFDARETPTAPPTVMVNQALARRLWPATSAVGRQLVVDYSTAGTFPYEVVGVVGDLRFKGPRSEPAPEIYLAHQQRPYLVMNVVVRTDGDPRALIPGVHAALRAVDPQKPAHGVHRLEDLVAATYARDRQVMVVLGLFALAAGALAVMSVYGVLSQRVRERTRELGIRVALGASPASLVAGVAQAGLRLVALGLGIGLAVTWSLSRVLSGVLFGVSPTDGVTAAAVAGVVAVVGAAATLLPACRTLAVDPVTVLRRG